MREWITAEYDRWLKIWKRKPGINRGTFGNESTGGENPRCFL